MKTKVTAISVEKTSSPITCGDAQGYSDPAQEKASNRGTATATRVAAPA